MADIELVIKMPEEIYKASQIIDVTYEDVIQIPLEVLSNGTPLPNVKADVLDKIRAEIIKYESDCRLSEDEYPSCKQCTDNVFETIYGILDKYKAESEV